MTDDGLVEALHVDGPPGPDAEQLQLFGQFIGSWDIAWSGLDADGRPRTARGELHFGWVLGGRAVQDVWIVPGRGEPGAGVRRWPSTARRSASTTPRSAPGARPGSIRSTAACAASSGARSTATSCCSATRTTRSCAGASPTSRRTRSLARRDLPRRRRHVDARRGDADHARRRVKGHRGGHDDCVPAPDRLASLERERVHHVRAASRAAPGRRRRSRPARRR